MIHLKKEVFILDFVNKPTIETAKSLLGVKISYQDQTQTYSGYIVETEAYLGFKDKAAHGFGGNKRLKSLLYINVVEPYMAMLCIRIYLLI